MNARTVLGLALCLMLTGCPDSKNPLSDLTTSKPDERLFGVWQHRWDNSGNVTYYHVGSVGKELPSGVIRVVGLAHSSNGHVRSPGEYLGFSTTLGGKTYLNLILSEQEAKLSEEKGLKADAIVGYSLFKYQIDGDKMKVWMMDAYAKRQAIETGKIKGVIEKGEQENHTVVFTDTTENIARYVAEAGDSLFSKEPLRLERVTTHPRRTEDAQAAPTPPLRPLGSNLMVDKKGIIWDGSHPVGMWGVDGCKTRPEQTPYLESQSGIIRGGQVPVEGRDENKQKQ
jgi:hypothetical protein